MADKRKTLVTNLLFKGSLDPSVKKSIVNIEKSFNALNSGVNKIYKGVAVATAAIGTAAAGATVALYKMGESWNDAARTIRIGTGATGKELEALTGSMQRVYETMPTEMGKVSQTIADINTLTGASGEALEKFSQATLQAAHMLGTDAKALYEPVSKAMNAFGVPVEQAAEKMDWLWKVSQSTGTGIGELAEAAKAGQNAFRTLGFSFEESTALLGQMDKAGLKGESAIAALKKAVTSLSSAGVKDFKKGFAAVTERIKNAKSETEAFNIASKVFGTKGGAEMAKAIRENKLSVDDLVKTLQASDETIAGAFSDTATGGEKLTVLWHKIQSAIKPAADAVYQGFQKLVPIFERLVERARPAIEKLASAFSAKVQEMSAAFDKWVDSIDFDAIAAGVSSVFAQAREWAGIIAANSDAIGSWVKRIGIAMAAIKGVSIALGVIKVAMGVWAVGKALVMGFVGALKLAKIAMSGIWWELRVVGRFARMKYWARMQTVWNAAMIAGKTAILAVWKGMKALFVWQNWVKVFTALQWAWNAAMSANPIGLIVVGIGAAIAAGWALYDNWDEVCAWCKEMWQAFADMFPKTAKFIETYWKMLCAEFEIAWEVVKAGLLASWENIKLTWDLLCSTLKLAWDNFSAAFSAVVKLFSGDFEGAKNDIMSIWTNLTEWFSGTLARFREYGDAIKNIFGAAWESIKAIAKGVIDSIMEYLQPLIDSIKGIFDTLGTIKDSVSNGISDAWDGAKSFVSSAWDGVTGMFASGGFTAGPSICGEAGTEAVISFDPAYRAQNQGYLMTAAEMLGMTAAPVSHSRVETRSTTYNLGGITFSPVIRAGSPEAGQSVLAQLKASIPDLVDLIEAELNKRNATRYA